MNEHATIDDAALWAVRLEEGQLSREERTELDAWLAAAPHHQGALIRARAVWLDLERVSALERPRRLASTRIAPSPGLRFGKHRRWVALLAASVAGIALLVYKSQVAGVEEYQTQIGEVRRIALEDGSTITLNSDSRAAVRLEKSQRIVKLERGEGLFEVAKDKSRPFLVWSGEVSVRAVGTVFAVRALPDDVSVTVTEGVVEVAQPREATQRVAVNQRAIVRPETAIKVAPEDPSVSARQLAWRSGMLSFAGESLGDAVLEANRYSKRQIVIEDSALAAKPVVGIFRMGDVDALAQAAAVALGAGVHIDDRVIRLTALPAR